MTTQQDERAELIRVLKDESQYASHPRARDVMMKAAALLAADGQAGGEAVAWLYTLEYGNTIADTKVSIYQLNYPFGVVGADYLRENQQGVSYVRETKLYK